MSRAVPGRPVASSSVPRPTTSSPAHRLLAGVAALGACLVVLVGCGEPTPTTKDLTDALVASGLPKEQSACIAKAVEGSLSKGELEKLVERGSGGAPVDDAKDTNDSADELRKAMDRCRAMVPPTTTSEVTASVPQPGATSTTLDVTTDGAKLDTTPSTTAP